MPDMSCTCAGPLTVQLHDGGERYPVVLVDEHTELSYFFDARCVTCGERHPGPFARADADGRPLARQREGLPLVDTEWLARQCGPFTCGAVAEEPEPSPSHPH